MFFGTPGKAALGLAGAACELHSNSAWGMPFGGKKLNFIFFLVDDLGWTDLRCFGSEFYETRNIDWLASRGMRFANAYTACTVCSPTRASILTGKYPAQLHITDWIEGHKYPFAKLKVPDWTMYLPHKEETIVEALNSAGYAEASVSIGKWHLGGEDYYPETQGFDLNIAGTHLGAPPSYFYPYKRGGRSIPTLKGGKDGEYITDRLTDEALDFIETKPKFLRQLPSKHLINNEVW